MKGKALTDNEVATIVAMVGSGESIKAVAKKLRMSLRGVHNALTCRGMSTQSVRENSVYSASDMVRILGIPPYRLRAILKRGFIEYTKNKGHNGRIVVDIDQFDAFLRNREGWVAWEVSDMNDPDWREVAASYREQTPGQWVSIVSWFEQHYYSKPLALYWARRGMVKTVVFSGRHYVWSKDIEGKSPDDFKVTREQWYSETKLSIPLGRNRNRSARA